MTRSIIEAWGRLVKWPSKNDAHSWPRSDDRRTMRPTGRVEYGNNRVQEIVSGTSTLKQDLQQFARAWFATLREQGFFAPTAVREILSPSSHRSVHGA